MLTNDWDENTKNIKKRQQRDDEWWKRMVVPGATEALEEWASDPLGAEGC